MASSQAAISAAAPSGRPGPTMIVRAASPCQPATIAPQSMDTRSPAASSRSAAGIPCTISSFTEMHSVAG